MNSLILKKRILVLNILDESDLEISFDKRIAEVFSNIDAEYEIVHLNSMGNFDRFDEFTHLLISGSVQSVTDELDWYSDLDAIVHRFFKYEKSILGICFGHQYLARHFAGKEHVRKSVTPEVGWIYVKHTDNPLFKNIGSFKSHVFHYDEVFDLDDQFEIIAHSARCDIHGFQLKRKPVWGIQFHPDFLYSDMFKFVDKQKDKDENFDQVFCKMPITVEDFQVNDLIFKNWIEIS